MKEQRENNDYDDASTHRVGTMVESTSTLASVEEFHLFELVLRHPAYSSCQGRKKLPDVFPEIESKTCRRLNISLCLEVIDQLRFFDIEVTRYIAMQKIYLQYMHTYIHIYLVEFYNIDFGNFSTNGKMEISICREITKIIHTHIQCTIRSNLGKTRPEFNSL